MRIFNLPNKQMEWFQGILNNAILHLLERLELVSTIQ